MTAEEWEACREPGPMLDLLASLHPGPSERKCRLCSVAFCRRIRPFPADVRVRAAIDAAERFADDWGTEQDRLVAWQAAVDARSPTAVLYTVSHGQIIRDARIASSAALHNPVHFREERDAQRRLVQCLFANPFRPPFAVSPAVRTHNDSAAVKLATVIYNDRDPTTGEMDVARLAILADALEDAGLDDVGALEHLRGPGPHCRGCHVVDAVLGR